MTNRLPVVNSDTNTWGTVLNGFLGVAHNADGTLKVAISVSDYGASPTATAAVNDAAFVSANTASAAVGGAVILLPPGGMLKTSASVVITSDNTILRGTGWNSGIQPQSGSNFDVISTPIPATVGLSGYVRNNIGIENLMVDCSNMTGTTAGRGNGIHLYGVRYSYIRDVYVKSCKNWAILSDGDNTSPGFNFGYDINIFRCVFDLCAANVWTVNSEANDIVNCRFKWCGGTCAALQPAFATQDTTGMHLRCSGGYMYIAGNVLGNGGTYTTEAIRLSNSGPCKVIGNRFDQTRNQAVVANGGNHMIIGNQFGSPGSAITGVPGIQIGSSNNTVIGNKFDTTAGAMNCTYNIAEAGGPFTNNIIAHNNLVRGTSGLVSLNAASTSESTGNPFYNIKDPAYGAVVDGTTDDTTAIQLAITAAQTAGGGIVLIPGPSLINNTLTISHDNIWLLGIGWYSQLIAGASMPAAPMVQVTVSSSTHRYGIKIADLGINGTNKTGVGGIELDNTYLAVLENVQIQNCPGTGIYLNGGPSSAYGAYTHIDKCSITNGGAGIGLLTNAHEFNTIRDTQFTWYNTAGGYGIKLTNGNNVIHGCTFDECDTSVWCYFTSNNSLTANQFDRGKTQFIYLNGAVDTAVQGNFFGRRDGTGTNMILVDSSSNQSNKIEGNYTQAAQAWTNFISEGSGLGSPNYYSNNYIGAYGVVRTSGIFKNNGGYNPVGHGVTQPGVPATTVAQTNTTGVDCTVFVAGGTVTVIAIGGTATGMTSGEFRVPTGQTITLTYSVAPTWQWFGD